MAKVIRHLREGQTEFQKVFSSLCNSKSAWQVWSDFVEMTAIAISNSCEIRPKVKQDREERYHSIINSYTTEEQKVFPQLISILTMALERNPEQDFLGEMFMAMELGSHWKGQFFTPYSVCKAMAAITIADAKERLSEKNWIGINDPACGAGATLIAARNQLELMRIGSDKAFFVAQDLDRTAGMMCYIQLSLLGCAGYVVIADTICNPVTGPMLWPNIKVNQEIWFMPMNFLDLSWLLRLNQTWRGKESVETNKSIEEEKTEQEPKAEATLQKLNAPTIAVEVKQEPKLTFKTAENGQLTLF